MGVRFPGTPLRSANDLIVFLLKLSFLCFNGLNLEEAMENLTLHIQNKTHGTRKTGNLDVFFSRQAKHKEFVKKYLFTLGIYYKQGKCEAEKNNELYFVIHNM